VAWLRAVRSADVARVRDGIPILGRAGQCAGNEVGSVIRRWAKPTAPPQKFRRHAVSGSAGIRAGGATGGRTRTQRRHRANYWKIRTALPRRPTFSTFPRSCETTATPAGGVASAGGRRRESVSPSHWQSGSGSPTDRCERLCRYLDDGSANHDGISHVIGRDRKAWSEGTSVSAPVVAGIAA